VIPAAHEEPTCQWVTDLFSHCGQSLPRRRLGQGSLEASAHPCRPLQIIRSDYEPSAYERKTGSGVVVSTQR